MQLCDLLLHFFCLIRGKTEFTDVIWTTLIWETDRQVVRDRKVTWHRQTFKLGTVGCSRVLDSTGIVVSELWLDGVGAEDAVSGKRTWKMTRNYILSQLETQEVPADRQEGITCLRCTNRWKHVWQCWALIDRWVNLPGDVLRELGGIRRVKLDIKGEIPGNTWKTKRRE